MSAQESKRKQVLLRFFALFTPGQGRFKQCQASRLSGFHLKTVQRCQEDLAKPLSSLLSEMEPLCPQSPPLTLSLLAVILSNSLGLRQQ